MVSSHQRLLSYRAVVGIEGTHQRYGVSPSLMWLASQEALEVSIYL